MRNYWKNKKVLVAGAAGFIGSHVVSELIKRHAVVTAVISPTTRRQKLQQNLPFTQDVLRIQKANLLESKKCTQIAVGQDMILNFAAMDGGTSFKRQYPAEIFVTNTQIVLNLLAAARNNSVDRLLIMSSIEVYPKSSPLPIRERYGFSQGLHKENDGYAWSKRFSEITSKMYYDQYGTKIAIARPGNIYGPRDYLDKGRVIPTFIKQALRNENITIWGKGTQQRSFLYVDDLTQALLQLVESYAMCDPINIASSAPIAIRDLAKLIISLTDSKSRLQFVNNDDVHVKDSIININKAKRAIHFKEYTSLSDGLQKTIDYFKQTAVL